MHYAEIIMGDARAVRLLSVSMLIALSPFPALADGSLSLKISGIVPAVATISVAAEAKATSLPLGASVERLKIATICERSNSVTGYSVTLASDNGGLLKEEGGTGALAYSLRYGGSAVALSAGEVLVAESPSRTASSGSVKELDISFPAASLEPGSYADTLTFTLAAK
jgi:hypothetical protein